MSTAPFLSSDPEKQTAVRTSWMMGPTRDLILFFPAIWGSLILFMAILFHQFEPARFPWKFMSVVNSLHTGLPIAYALFFSHHFPTENKKKMLGGFLFFLVIFALSWKISQWNLGFMTILLPTFFVLIATYHFYRQDLGICSMYRSRDMTCKSWEKDYERYLILFFAFIIPTVYWISWGRRYDALVRYWGGALHWDWLLNLLSILATVLFGGYVGYQLLWKRNFNPRFLYMGGLYLFVLTMLKSSLFLFPFFIEIMARTFTHDWVEIGIQSKMASSELKSSRPFNRWRVLAWIGSAVLVAIFFNFSKVTYAFMTDIQSRGDLNGQQFLEHAGDSYFQIWATFYLALSALHYYIGRYVYDFSVPAVRKNLDFGSYFQKGKGFVP